MFNKKMLMAFAKKVEVDDPRYMLSFVASKDGSGINFFTDISSTYHPDSAFTVKINGETTDQSYKSLSFVSGDEVVITCDKDFSFPQIYTSKDYFSAVSALPLMTDSFGDNIKTYNMSLSGCSSLTNIPENLFVNNTKVTKFFYALGKCTGLTSIPENLFANNTEVDNFEQVFNGCSGLTSIPENLFANNTKVTNFEHAFKKCSSLASIPENLFANNTKVTSFGYTFNGCSGLTSIPENLFANNTKVTSFSYTFNECTALSGRIKIGSPNVTDCKRFCYGTGAMTVIVPAGSTTEATFRAYAETVSNLTVETY